MKDIKDIETVLQEKLEKKKLEIISAGGSLGAMKEASKIHKGFISAAREELTELVGEGKISAEIANYVLSWLDRSHSKIKELVETAKSYSDIKTGEAIAHDNILKSIRESKEIEEIVTLQELPQDIHAATESQETTTSETDQPESEPVLAMASVPEEKPKKERRKPKAQERSKKIDDTVKRLKKSRSEK